MFGGIVGVPVLYRQNTYRNTPVVIFGERKGGVT